MDIVTYLLQVTNVFAALFGAAVVIILQKLVPPANVEIQSPRLYLAVAIANRLLPFVAVIASVIAVFVLEKVTTVAFFKGVVSGLLAEQFVRIWYKSIVGA